MSATPRASGKNVGDATHLRRAFGERPRLVDLAARRLGQRAQREVDSASAHDDVAVADLVMPRVTVEHVEERGTFVDKAARERARAFGKIRELTLLLLDLAEQRDICDRRNQRDRKAGRRYQICGPCRCVLHRAYLPKEASRPFARTRRTSAVMEPLEQLRAKIAGFPGYDGDLERRRSDEYVRSYLGEALADFAGRCTLPAELQARVDAADSTRRFCRSAGLRNAPHRRGAAAMRRTSAPWRRPTPRPSNSPIGPARSMRHRQPRFSTTSLPCSIGVRRRYARQH